MERRLGRVRKPWMSTTLPQSRFLHLKVLLPHNPTEHLGDTSLSAALPTIQSNPDPHGQKMLFFLVDRLMVAGSGSTEIPQESCCYRMRGSSSRCRQSCSPTSQIGEPQLDQCSPTGLLLPSEFTPASAHSFLTFLPIP